MFMSRFAPSPTGQLHLGHAYSAILGHQRARESGGPAVTMPDRQGFGTTVVSTLAEISLGAEVALTYASTGLCWRLVCKAEEVLDPGHATKTAD